MTDEGTSSLAPTPEVIARRLRDLRQTAGQHEAQLGRHGEQLASIGEQLRELARLQQLASTRHADLAAAVAEDLAVKVDALSTLVRRGARFAVHLRVTRVALGGLLDPVAGAQICLTVCQGCRESDRPPSVMLSTAQRLVEQHRQHLAGPDRPTYRTRLPS